jgi:hypothetical protein
MTESPHPATPRFRWTLAAVVALGVLVAGLAVAGLLVPDDGADRADDEDGATDRPLAVVSVVDPEHRAEEPPADLWLVELGQPVRDGVLLVEDSGFDAIPVAGDETTLPRGTPSPGVVELPDQRLLVGFLHQQDEYVRNVGAVTVDRVTGRVDTVYRNEDVFDAGSLWDPETRVLHVGGQLGGGDETGCYRWDAGRSASGFVSADECPPPPPQPELGLYPFGAGGPVAAIWEHEHSGTIFVATDVDRGIRTESRLQELIGSSNELLSVEDEMRQLLAVSPDGSRVVLTRPVNCFAGRCEEELAVASKARTRVLVTAPVVVSAFLVDDGHRLVFTTRRFDTFPYQERSYEVDMAGDGEPDLLYDATVEAVVGHDSGLALLDECPPEMDCDALG